MLDDMTYSSVFFNMLQRQMNTDDAGEIVTFTDEDGKKHTLSVAEVNTNWGKENPYQNNRVFPYSIGFRL